MLVNSQIRALGSGLFHPYDGTLIHSTSIGLEVGEGLLTENLLFNGHGGGLLKKFQLPGLVHSIAWHVLDLMKNDHTQYRPWSLSPGCLVLVTTKQDVFLPFGLCGMVVPAESARLNGYGISNQAVVYGHQGPLTLVVKNMTQKTQLPMFPGLHLAELCLYALDKIPDADLLGLDAGSPTDESLLALPETTEIEDGDYVALAEH